MNLRSLLPFVAAGAFIISLVPSSSAVAQSDALRSRFGVFGDVDLNFHTADLPGLPGIPTCSPVFQSGFGMASSAGLFYELPTGNDLMLVLRAGYLSNSTTLARDEQQIVEVDGDAVPVTIEHRIDATLASVALSPMIGWHVIDGLTLMGGGEIGLVITKSYAQEERLSDEVPRGTFENGRRVRNESSGELPQASSIAAALVLGASYEFPLNQQGTLLAAPEVLAAYGVTPVISGLSWNAHALRAGLALKYSPLPSVEEPVPPPVESKPPVLAATVTASGIAADGSEEPAVRLRVEEFIATEMRPLLGYVFFDKNSPAIPDRYARLLFEHTESFTPDSLYGSDGLAVYHQMLNIIGYRMRQHPSATLQLVGTNAGAGSETGGRTLSLARAETVRDYLRNTWGIVASRLKVEGVDLPSVPSNPAYAEGIEENRRVELYTDNPGILEPVMTADTLREMTPPGVRFHTSVQAEAGVASWQLTAIQNGTLLKTFSGYGNVPEKLDWQPADAQGSIPKAPGEVQYQLTVNDLTGQSYQSSVGQLPVEQVTVRKKRQERIADVAIERYSLILFDYDRAELSAGHRRLIEDIRKRITPESRVRVVGYADQTGDADHNQRLSLDRAKAVAHALEVKDEQITVMGETTPLYDQSLPEGRFNSRTVTIEIETTVKEGDSG